MTILHLELYEKGTLIPTSGWELNTQKPHGLIDPIELFKSSIAQIK